MKQMLRTISVPEEDQWIIRTIDKIVAHKKAMGLPSSFAREAVRLMKNGLTNALIQAEIDVEVVKNSK
jgi:hypothetical protein